MGNIASVVINGSTREFDREYDYLVPEELEGKVMPGVRVIVPFGGGNSIKEAYVVNTPESSRYSGLKQIRKLIDETPVLLPNMLELAGWMKKRYICTFSDAIRCMLPAGIGVKSCRIIRLAGCTEDFTGNKGNIVTMLKECGGACEYAELQRNSAVKGFSKYIKELEEQCVICINEEYSTAVREKTVRAASLAMSGEEVMEDIRSGAIKRIQQIRVLEMLLDNEFISVSDLARFAGVSTGVLDTLRKNGYIYYRDVEVIRNPVRSREFERTSPMPPTVQQAAAIDSISDMLDSRNIREVLLHGVTGSGKTEVYLQLISHVLNQGRQAIVLVPEISLTPQMVERFAGRFGNDVAVLHSRLSLGERYDQWRMIREGKVNVVVGARSAVFAPLGRLGIIIIDEEHESSYKSETTPKYHAADIAKKRCLDENALLLYGSATPSIETYYRAINGEIQLIELSERVNNMDMPRVDIVDMRDELEAGNRSVFSRRLSDELTRNIEARQQAILFLNRRGHSSFVLCRSCGHVIKCPECNISLTYHSYEDRLICHYCGYTAKMPSACPKCGSAYIRQFGIGTQKVEEEVGKQFRDGTVIRMDMDTTSCKNSHEEILRKFREQNINVLVGTQMIAKGHDFPNVTLVGVLAADALLNMDDYRASERTFQLVTQVAGRAGRGELPGRVVVQTYNTENFSIKAACAHDYITFYNQEVSIRKLLRYPPYTNIAAAVLSGLNDRAVFDAAKGLKAKALEKFGELKPDELILGPMRCPVTKIRSRYRWRLVIKCGELEKLINVLSEISDEFYRENRKNSIDLNVDTNPMSML